MTEELFTPEPGSILETVRATVLEFTDSGGIAQVADLQVTEVRVLEIVEQTGTEATILEVIGAQGPPGPPGVGGGGSGGGNQFFPSGW